MATALLAVTAAAPVAAAPGVEEEDIASQIASFRQLLDQGNRHLASLDFPEAVDVFTKLIDAYKAGKIPLVTPDAKQIVARAFEGRALGFANQARNQDASADFESLIRFDPGYSVDVKGVSQKVVQTYLAVRKRILGGLSIDGEPIGADVKLDAQAAGVSPITDRDWIAGGYHLVISHQGFDPYEEDVKIEAGAKLVRKFHLVPNSRSVQIATVPRDVKVVVDGVERGSTFGMAGPAYDDVAREMGIVRSDVSEPLLVEFLKPGEHQVILRKECYEEVLVPINVQIDPANNAPVAYKPLVLSPSRGSVDVQSEPGGAQILLDGKPAGTTPAVLDGICSGKHDLALSREGMGRSMETVDVRNAETAKLRLKLKLSLAAIDLRGGSTEGESLLPALKGLSRYNVVGAGAGIPADLLDRVRLEVESSPGKGLASQTVKDLLRSLNVELLALRIPSGTPGESPEIQLYSGAQPVPDRRRLGAAEGDGLRKLALALDGELPIAAAWLGVKLIDVRGAAHPIALGVTSGSPAAVSGVLPGDVLTAVGGASMSKSSDLLPVLRKAAPGDELVLTVETSGRAHDVKVKCLATPVLLPMRDASILYNKAIVDLTQAAAAATDRSRAGFAWMNVGVALMHFARYDEAIRDAFKRADLADGAGISKGTIRYLTGICFERLGMPAEARAAYLEAAASPSATVESHDGPVLAPSAKRRAAALTSPAK
ncbi:MAG: PEGA domain-containing protein [Acidobacteria bacterium]|nr:PEGA domain-containing protein [Acidobacteriota bacterium]